jgi:hypothetical protein
MKQIIVDVNGNATGDKVVTAKVFSDNIRNSNDTEVNFNTTMVCLKRMKFSSPFSGSLKLLFDVKVVTYGTVSVEIRRFSNQHVISAKLPFTNTNYITQSGNYPLDFNAGDGIELWGEASTSGAVGALKNFRFAYDDDASIAIPTI